MSHTISMLNRDNFDICKTNSKITELLLVKAYAIIVYIVRATRCHFNSLKLTSTAHQPNLACYFLICFSQYFAGDLYIISTLCCY